MRSAEASRECTTAVGRLSPIPRRFDLGRYAATIQKAYGHLKLGSIDSDWTTYDRRVRLESVYVPQSVKQAIPPGDVTRDYLRSEVTDGAQVHRCHVHRSPLSSKDVRRIRSDQCYGCGKRHQPRPDCTAG